MLCNYICLVLRNTAKIFVIPKVQLQGVCRSVNCMTRREKLHKFMKCSVLHRAHYEVKADIQTWASPALGGRVPAIFFPHKEQSMSQQCLKPLVTEFFLHLGTGYEGWFLCEVILTFTLCSTMTPKTKECWTWKVKKGTTLWPQRIAWGSRSSSICSVLLSLKVFS